LIPPELAARPVHIGARVARVEDDRLLTGRGTYVADVDLPGTVEVAVVRSIAPHARIRGIGTEAARSLDGVLAVVTASDLTDVRPFPDFLAHARPTRTFPLARDRVRYVGAPVAAVVAEDRYRAEDAAEAVEVDYESLPAVGTMEQALAPDAPRLFEEWPDNRMVEVRGSNPAVEAILSSSRVVRGRFSIQRHTAVPMETRGGLAEYRDGRLTLWTSTQSPHIVRTTLSYVLPLAERHIRVVAPDVGGGFGCKCHVYPEDVLVCWLAMKLGRPVRWVEDRAEHLVATGHAREHVLELEAAVAEDGTLRAVRCRILHDVGSGELFFPGINPSFVAGGHITGPYRIEHAEVSVTCVVTNKTPSGAFRGFGIPEAVFALERLVDRAAREVGRDPLEVRRKMLLRPEDLPYVTATGGVLDSGSFGPAFERAVELAREAERRARDRFGRDPSVRIGSGVATYVEGTAPTYFGTTGHWTSHDAATVRVEPDGSVVVAVGVTTTGQGVTTMVATLAADALGVPRESVRVVIGDTDRCPYGLGGWGSRSTVVGGGAVLRAAAPVRDKVLRVAAHLLEAAPEDLALEDGRVRVRGTDRSVSLAEVATTAWVRTLDLPPGEDPGLEATATYDPPGLQHRPGPDGRMNGAAAWANATHAAVVRVDLDTGAVEVLDYLVAHDCGRVINPVVLDGQIQGGVAQGIAGALYEHVAYSPEGLPQAGSFMDYLIPSAAEVPDLVIEHFESPAPEMPLGVKGAGEAGTVGPGAAIANAVSAALADLGVEVDATPITPASLRRMIRAARAPAPAG
jgi:carbon-monoxide dehydrogenase large subunit